MSGTLQNESLENKKPIFEIRFKTIPIENRALRKIL
jgi:hypothetical protein